MSAKRPSINSLYKRTGTPGECTYCGLPASELDHVVPISAWQRYGTIYIEDKGGQFLLVPVCTECNAILSDKPLWNLRDRLVYVKECLHKRYSSILAMPTWTDDELEELGEELASIIRGERSKYHVLITRLLHKPGGVLE